MITHVTPTKHTYAVVQRKGLFDDPCVLPTLRITPNTTNHKPSSFYRYIPTPPPTPQKITLHTHSGVFVPIYANTTTHPNPRTVVQRKGLFDDPAEEVNALMHAIKEDIEGLNSLVEGTQVGWWLRCFIL